MTKQVEDKFTSELPGFGGRPRGRPAKPDAMTAAQRKAAQRARAKGQGKVSREFMLSLDVVEALDKFVESKDEDRSAVVDRILRDRLLRKR
jgi:hypothetical protein